MALRNRELHARNDDDDDVYAWNILSSNSESDLAYCVICRFNSPFEKGDTRFLITNAMHVGPSSVLEFELVMGCRHAQSQYDDEPVRLEYSTDHGMTWSLVLDGCWPPSTCTHYHSPSVYHTAEFPHWRRVTIILPISTWCVVTFKLNYVRFCSKVSKYRFVQCIIVNTPLMCYHFPYVGADLCQLVLSQTPSNTARPRIRAIVPHNVPGTHHGGITQAESTWVPGSAPRWFTRPKTVTQQALTGPSVE